MDELIEFSGRLADAARPVTLKYFRSGLVIDSKTDESPVTRADREAERIIRELIGETWPEHGIYGEEFDPVRLDAEYVWIIDPIDGTQAFATGKPLFGILIALVHKNKFILGVLDMPALNERWTGAKGRATTFNDKAVTTRPCPDLNTAWIYATSPEMFRPTHFPGFENLKSKCRRAIYGAECQAYGLLASGWTDIVCEDTLQPYDFAAMVPIIEGAGGIITDWQGKPLNMESGGDVIAAGDKTLHKAALDCLKMPLP